MLLGRRFSKPSAGPFASFLKKNTEPSPPPPPATDDLNEHSKLMLFWPQKVNNQTKAGKAQLSKATPEFRARNAAFETLISEEIQFETDMKLLQMTISSLIDEGEITVFKRSLDAILSTSNVILGTVQHFPNKILEGWLWKNISDNFGLCFENIPYDTVVKGAEPNRPEADQFKKLQELIHKLIARPLFYRLFLHAVRITCPVDYTGGLLQLVKPVIEKGLKILGLSQCDAFASISELEGKFDCSLCQSLDPSEKRFKYVSTGLTRPVMSSEFPIPMTGRFLAAITAREVSWMGKRAVFSEKCISKERLLITILSNTVFLAKTSIKMPGRLALLYPPVDIAQASVRRNDAIKGLGVIVEVRLSSLMIVAQVASEEDCRYLDFFLNQKGGTKIPKPPSTVTAISKERQSLSSKSVAPGAAEKPLPAASNVIFRSACKPYRKKEDAWDPLPKSEIFVSAGSKDNGLHQSSVTVSMEGSGRPLFVSPVSLWTEYRCADAKSIVVTGQNPTLGVGLYLVKLKDTPEKDAFLQSIKQAQALMVKAGLEKCSALIRQTTQEEVVTKEVVDENIFTTFSTHGYVGSSRNDPLIDLGPVKLIIATYRDADSAAHRLKNARIAVSSTIDSNITAIRAKLYNGRAAFEVAGSTLSVQFTIPGSKTERSEALKLASSSNQTETGSLNEQCSDSPSFFTVVVKLADAATAADVAGRVATMRDILPVHPDDTVEGDDGAGDSGKSGAAQTDARPEPKPAGRVGLKWAAVPPPAGGATPASGSGSPVRVSQSGASSGAWYKAGWVASRVAFFNDCARRAAGSVTGPVGRRRKVSATVQAAQQQQQTPATEEEPRESNALLKAACGEDIASYSPVCEETEVPASKVGGAFSLPAGDAESAASDVTSKTSIEPTVGAAVAAEPLSTDDLMVVERLDGDVTIAAQDIYERLFEQSALSKESYWGGVNEKRCYYFPPVGIPQELVVAWSRIPYEAQKLLAGGANQALIEASLRFIRSEGIQSKMEQITESSRDDKSSSLLV